jgi:hypothetical protein
MFVSNGVCSFVSLNVLFEKCDFLVNNGVNNSFYLMSLFICCINVLSVFVCILESQNCVFSCVH